MKKEKKRARKINRKRVSPRDRQTELTTVNRPRLISVRSSEFNRAFAPACPPDIRP